MNRTEIHWRLPDPSQAVPNPKQHGRLELERVQLYALGWPQDSNKYGKREDRTAEEDACDGKRGY